MKMFGECEEGDIFFASTVENTNGADAVVGEAHDLAAGAAEFALKRLDACGRRVEALLEEFYEDVHRHGFH